MPVQAKDRIVHNVEYCAKPGRYGLTACGLVYASKKPKDTWKTRHRDHNVPVYPMRRTRRVPTCLGCILGVRINYPW